MKSMMMMLRFHDKKVMSVIISVIANISILFSQNPILPPTAFIPDGEPHIFIYNGEERLFLYGSTDQYVTTFCGAGIELWSAPVNDLTQWTCHGEIFNVKQIHDLGFGRVDRQWLGASDCVYNPLTKKYYLYTFMGVPYKMNGKEGPLPGAPNYIKGFEDFGPRCVVASSDSPVGPFTNPVICDWPALNMRGTFDPTVLVQEQEDGSVRVYAYWGMLGGDCWAEISPADMHTIIDGKTGKPNRSAWYRTLNNPEMNNHSTLFEASSIKQIAKDKYVFIYSARERIHALSYCYSDSPEGPWKYGGRIVDNGIHWSGGNNHGSIVQVNGQWYVCYHRKTNNDFNRQAMMEPIEVHIHGDKVIIPTVEMTSQGIQTEGLNAFQIHNAYRVCYSNGPYIDGAKRDAKGENPIVNIKDGSVIGFKYFNFGEKAINSSIKLNLNIECLDKTEIGLEIASPEDADNADRRITLKAFPLHKYIPADGKYHKVEIPIKRLMANENLNTIGGLKGKMAVFLTFKGKGQDLCRLKEIGFIK